MTFDPDTIDIPKSYETVPLTDIKVSHHPAGALEATPVIVVTLNRPEKHNSFTLDMMHVFEKIYPMFDVDERVKVVVLTGAGKMFCAGADLERGFSGMDKVRNQDYHDSGGRLALAIHRCRGIFPPVSPHFGTLFQETYADADQVVARALELATEIAENVSPMASYLSRELMWRNPGSAEETHLVDSEVLYHMLNSAEGIKAFFEKRKPNFNASLEVDAPPSFPWWSDIDTRRRPKASKGKL
ncbi:unnamed protein product [Penicillium glandicola]